MTRGPQDSQESAIRDEAAAFVVRLCAEGAAEAGWLALESWLAGDPARRAAFDSAEALWSELDDSAAEIAAALAQASAPVALVPRKTTGPDWRWMSLAAAAAVVLALAGVSSLPLPHAPETVYRTGPGQTRIVVLADGTQIHLNGASTLTVSFRRGERRVTMGQAEAAFDVAKDMDRPFVVAVGEDEIRVVGTEFDINRQAASTTVTVRRGIVEVRRANAPDASPLFRLVAGQQLVHADGQTQAAIAQVKADDGFAWQSGRLICHDRPLAQVAADLSRRFAVPVTTDAAAGDLRFTGVLVLDNQEAVITRLEALLPIKADRAAGAITLRSNQ